MSIHCFSSLTALAITQEFNMRSLHMSYLRVCVRLSRYPTFRSPPVFLLLLHQHRSDHGLSLQWGEEENKRDLVVRYSKTIDDWTKNSHCHFLEGVTSTLDTIILFLSLSVSSSISRFSIIRCWHSIDHISLFDNGNQARLISYTVDTCWPEERRNTRSIYICIGIFTRRRSTRTVSSINRKRHIENESISNWVWHRSVLTCMGTRNWIKSVKRENSWLALRRKRISTALVALPVTGCLMNVAHRCVQRAFDKENDFSAAYLVVFAVEMNQIINNAWHYSLEI